jgi:hypothetical protein
LRFQPLRGIIFVAPLVFAAAATLVAANPAAAEAPHRAKALVLARAVFSGDSMAEGMGRIMQAKVKETLGADPRIQEQERAHPGLIEAIAARVRTVITEGTRASVPVLWERLANVYAARLIDAQIDDEMTFISGPVGQKLAARFADEALNVDPDALAQRASSGRTEDAALEAVAGLSGEELEALSHFAHTPAGAALFAADDEARAVRIQWSRETTDALKPRAEDAIVSTAETFLGPRPAKMQSRRQH